MAVRGALLTEDPQRMLASSALPTEACLTLVQADHGRSAAAECHGTIPWRLQASRAVVMVGHLGIVLVSLRQAQHEA